MFHNDFLVFWHESFYPGKGASMGRRNTKISTMIPKDVNTMHDTQVPQTNYFIRVTSTNWYSICQVFWQYIWHSIWHILTSFGIHILTFHPAFCLAFLFDIYIYILTFYQAFYLTSLLTFYLNFWLTFYVTSCVRNWGPAVPTEIWLSQLGSGTAFAVGVRQCPIRTGARG